MQRPVSRGSEEMAATDAGDPDGRTSQRGTKRADRKVRWTHCQTRESGAKCQWDSNQGKQYYSYNE